MMTLNVHEDYKTYHMSNILDSIAAGLLSVPLEIKKPAFFASIMN